MFPDIFTKMEVVGNDAGRRVILCEERWAGRRFRYKMRETQIPPNRIEHLITEGNGKGSTQTLALEETPIGTKVTMTLEAKGLMASLMGKLFRKQFEAEMDRIFEGYVRVIEASA